VTVHIRQDPALRTNGLTQWSRRKESEDICMKIAIGKLPGIALHLAIPACPPTD